MSKSSGWNQITNFLSSSLNPGRGPGYEEEQGRSRASRGQGEDRSKLKRSPSQREGPRGSNVGTQKGSYQADRAPPAFISASSHPQSDGYGRDERDSRGQPIQTDSRNFQGGVSISSGPAPVPERHERDYRPQSERTDSRERVYPDRDVRPPRTVGPPSRRNSRYATDEGAQPSYEEALRIIDDLRVRVRHREDRVQELTFKYADLDKKNAALDRENEKLGDDIRELQERSFNSMGDARWMPLDNGTVTAELNKIREAIGLLAKSYAADNFFDLEKETYNVHMQFRASLSPYVHFGHDGPGPVLEFLRMKHAPRLALTALISGHVHWYILGRPFFFVSSEFLEGFDKPDSNDRPRLQRNEFNLLDTIYSTACNYDMIKANVWRSDTLRLLNPLHLADEEAGKLPLRRARESVDDASYERAAILDSGLETWFFRKSEKGQKDTREQFTQELAQIFVDAGRLSARLWTQRPSLVFYYLSSLVREPFTVSSEMLEAHRLHKLDDPNDHRLDGRLPKVVVHPAIVAFGTHDADHYDRNQVLAKAVVCLEA